VKDYIARLQQAIRDLHGCESQYLETVPVKERSFGKVTLKCFRYAGIRKQNELMLGRIFQGKTIKKLDT
jgi:hypothetical protein